MVLHLHMLSCVIMNVFSFVEIAINFKLLIFTFANNDGIVNLHTFTEITTGAVTTSLF